MHKSAAARRSQLRSAIDRDAAASIEGMVFALDPDGRVCGT
jgi:hypothetical protein